MLEEIHSIAENSTLNPQQLFLIHAVQSGQNLARDLGNRPGNICFPEYLAEQAQALAAQYPDLLKVTVINEQQMADLGMNAFLAVSKGSDRPGRVITSNIKPILNRPLWYWSVKASPLIQAVFTETRSGHG